MTASAHMRDRFVRDHARIRELADQLISLLRESGPPEPQGLSTARWAFASNLMQHLAIKERHLYAKLEHDARPEVMTYYRVSKDDLLKRFAAYTRHMEAWPTSQAMADWDTYRPKAIAVVQTFTERLRNEEMDLFPFLDRFGIDISTPSSVTSNWTRKAFEVKAKVDDR